MSEIEPGPGVRRPSDPDEHDDDWTEDVEQADRPGRWSRLTRNGLRRPSMPLLAAACVGVLAVLVGIAVGGRGEPGPTPPAAASGGQATDEPMIEFDPVSGGGDTSPGATPGVTEDPTPSPGASSGAPTPTPGATGTPLPTPAPGTSSGSAPAPAPVAPKVTFTEVGGYHCTSTGTRGFRHSGWYKDGDEGWYSTSTGGWGGDGCEGHFTSMPMSGFKTKDDSGLYGEWWFAVGASTRSCAVSTYVPTTKDSRDVAGAPATYQVRDIEGGPVKATFTVNQSANRGRWVASGTYAVTGGRIVVRVVNRGQDWDDSGRTLDHIGIAQLRVTCH
ncbi:hypothetical protein ABT346_04010 [Micromonospora peucetia]|uniref:hypothetical protein n=1 Tax=Micromonospora peucetia TaxID=47871 RepID=UPI003331A396